MDCTRPVVRVRADRPAMGLGLAGEPSEHCRTESGTYGADPGLRYALSSAPRIAEGNRQRFQAAQEQTTPPAQLIRRHG